MATILKITGKLSDTTLPILQSKRLLDALTNIDRAYSLRLIRGAYNGPLIRVRRSSDSATRDIAALPDGQLDTAVLKAFAGNGDVFVHTLYDQSANGKHLTQATQAAQAKVVSAGSIVTANGKPAMTFDGVDDAYVDSSPALWAHGSATLTAVLTAEEQPGQSRWWTESRAAATNEQYGLLQPDGSESRAPKAYPIISGVLKDSTMVPQPSLAAWEGSTKQYSSVDTGAAISQWINGANDLGGVTYTRPTRSVDRFTFGGVTRSASLAPMAFTFSEAIWLKGAASASIRASIERDQKSFFGIP